MTAHAKHQLLAWVGIALLLTGCTRSRTYEQKVGTSDIYWMERAPTTRHGICAHMYHAQDGTWRVEKPNGVNPETRMSLTTDLGTYSTEKEARAWITPQCP